LSQDLTVIPFSERALHYNVHQTESPFGDERQIADMNMKITTTDNPLESMDKERNLSFDNADRLDSWKEIACYLNRNVRTVQRWEACESMPVHRHLHAKSGSVYAFRSELDNWRKERSYCRPPRRDQTKSIQYSEKALINDKEQALLRTVLEAILVQLTTQTLSAVSLPARPIRRVATSCDH
jgi:hypothetical protein